MKKTKEIEKLGKDLYESKLLFLNSFLNRKIVNYNYYDILCLYNELLDEIAEIEFEMSMGIRNIEESNKILIIDNTILEELKPIYETMLKEKKESKKEEKKVIKKMMDKEGLFLLAKQK